MTNLAEDATSEPLTLRQAGTERVAIGHALIDNCTAAQVCDRIVAHARSRGRASYVATANAQHIVLLNKDARFREVYSKADLVVADGMSLLFAARLYRRSLQQRVAGVDIFEMLCGMAAEQGLRVFLLGGRPGSAQSAGAVLRSRYPGLRVATYCPEFGFESTQQGLEQTADAIRSVNPDLLFVALGAPKQEFWIYEHGLALSVPVSMGVGGSFELIAGVVPRAPEWLQQAGLEWFYRLCLEPRRMWRRYLIGNVEFAATVGRQYVRGAVLEVFHQWTGRVRPAAELQG